jgi:hypothetical protein
VLFFQGRVGANWRGFRNLHLLARLPSSDKQTTTTLSAATLPSLPTWGSLEIYGDTVPPYKYLV